MTQPHADICVCMKCEDARAARQSGITQAEINSVIDVLMQLTFEIQTYHIDWAKLNSESPDYDRNYKPEFPLCVGRAETTIKWLKTLKLS